MRGPNEQDDPGMDQEYYVGETVYYTGSNWRLQMWHAFTVREIGSSRTNFDYKIAAPDGTVYEVAVDDIARERPRISSPVALGTPEQERYLARVAHARERAWARYKRCHSPQAYDLYDRLHTRWEDVLSDMAFEAECEACAPKVIGRSWDDM